MSFAVRAVIASRKAARRSRVFLDCVASLAMTGYALCWAPVQRSLLLREAR
ncbi:MAG: hypothetical protein IID18_00820 [Nitrospinae bacterium]|nr:hypothetical protein [Nitrospinota bacterium]